MNETGTMVVGLTGQTGAGKSTISRMFAARGVEIIDADKVARVTMENSPSCLSDLVLEFSTEVIHPDATLNREKLAKICFSDKKKLKRLNDITFPYIFEAIVRKLEDAVDRGVPMVVLDAPTLFEAGLGKRCDRVAAVIAQLETRVARIVARDSMTDEAARRRVNAQNDDAFYTSRADYVLTNNDDLDGLRYSFDKLFVELERMATDGSYRVKPPRKPLEEPAQSDVVMGVDAPVMPQEAESILEELEENEG